MATRKKPATTVRSETEAEYLVAPQNEDAIIEKALEILRSRFKPGEKMQSPTAVKNYLILSDPDDGREYFRILWLDSQHHVIDLETVSVGTLTQASVYPREVIKAGLNLRAAACILTHNHPSGCLDPSTADKNLTTHLKKALDLVDIRLLDHVITAKGSALSFAERGLL